MNRLEFVQNSLLSLITMNTLKDLKKLTDTFTESETKMPVLFVGHGSPMNGIEDNEFSRRWAEMGKDIPLPRAVIVVSAHWFTSGTKVTAMDRPRTIHDFYGFPKALFDVQYPAPGNTTLASETVKLIKKAHVTLDHDWGLDHGTWSIVRHMYPAANIPVLQLSIDFSKAAKFHYELARELNALRKKGVLIIGSGNMVHNLGMVDWHHPDSGFDWAIEMNENFKKLITEGNHEQLIDFESMGHAAKLSIPTPEHYLPLLYTLGLQEKDDAVKLFNDKTLMGSISMTSVKVG